MKPEEAGQVRDPDWADIREPTIIRLSAEDQRRFVEALLAPPKISPAMLRAYEHRKRLVGDNNQ